MNGKAHYKIGILSYAIASLIPAIHSSPILNNTFVTMPKEISLLGLAIAGIAALSTDADSANSKINHMNPIIGTASGFIKSVESLLKIAVKFLIGVGFGALIFIYSQWIIRELSLLESIKKQAPLITYGTGALLILSGLVNEAVLKKFPILGSVYKEISTSIRKGGNKGKRAVLFLLYAGTGVALALYNLKHLQDFYMYLISALFIAIAIFPHRSFLHSLEGLVIVTFSMSYALNRIGYGQYTGCFFIGYSSHIYWADIFTYTGVPLFIFPRILKSIGIKSKWIATMAKFKLRLPPHMSTGSPWGNFFETVYVLVLFLITALVYEKYGGVIRLF